MVALVIAFVVLRPIAKGPQPSKRSHRAVNASPSASAPLQETWYASLLRFDWIGVILFIGSAIVFLLGLSLGSTTSTWGAANTIACLVVGSVFLLIFIGWEYLIGSYWIKPRGNHTPKPPLRLLTYTEALIPLEMFKNYNIVACCIGSFATGMVSLAPSSHVKTIDCFLPSLDLPLHVLLCFHLFHHRGRKVGYSVRRTGEFRFPQQVGQLTNASSTQLLYFAPGLGIGSFLQIIIVKRLRQPKYALILGGALLPLSTGLMSMAIYQANEPQIDGFMALCGVGVGMMFGPLALQARFTSAGHLVAVIQSQILLFRELSPFVQAVILTKSRLPWWLGRSSSIGRRSAGPSEELHCSRRPDPAPRSS